MNVMLRYVCMYVHMCVYMYTFSHTCDIRQANFNLQFIYYKNTAYNLWVHNVHNVMKKLYKSLICLHGIDISFPLQK